MSTTIEVPVLDSTIQYLKDVAAEGARLAAEGTYSLNNAMAAVDRQKQSQTTTAFQSSQNRLRPTSVSS